jgi:predicted nuclease of restriction endonuclease-like (RecB) superfamily
MRCFREKDKTMSNIILNNEYKQWLIDLKSRIRNSQIKAAISVNSELISLYWDLGRMIVEKQEHSKWGSKLIEQLAKDLKAEFPDMSSFSKRNLFFARQFYLFYSNPEIVKQVVSLLENQKIQGVVSKCEKRLINSLVLQIPWGHHILILQKTKDSEEAIFYIRETITNNWSRNILGIQIESGLYRRQGKAVSNFSLTLPKPQSDLATQILKDPYIFDFLTLEKNVQELEFEKQLISNITQFLLELGKGFAYMGRQYPLQIGNKECFLNLLFYHVKLRCYVVVELKMGEFEPEYIGKLNYYLSAVDDTLKSEHDQPSVGILLCKTKDKLDVEYALRNLNTPIGVSEFRFNELPADIQLQMPTVEELENELFKTDGFNYEQ